MAVELPRRCQIGARRAGGRAECARPPAQRMRARWRCRRRCERWDMGKPIADAIDSGSSFPMKMPASGTDHGQRLVPERFGAPRQPLGQAGGAPTLKLPGVQGRPAGPEPGHRGA